MGTKAHVAYGQKEQALVKKLVDNADILGENAAQIVRDIHTRAAETLSAKQMKMLTEMGDKVDATLKARKSKPAGAGASA